MLSNATAIIAWSVLAGVPLALLAMLIIRERWY
jgi:hypothetical protein